MSDRSPSGDKGDPTEAAPSSDGPDGPDAGGQAPSAAPGAIPGWGQTAGQAPSAPTEPPPAAAPGGAGGSGAGGGAIPGWGQTAQAQPPPPPPAGEPVQGWAAPASPPSQPAGGWEPPPQGPSQPAPPPQGWGMPAAGPPPGQAPGGQPGWGGQQPPPQPGWGGQQPPSRPGWAAPAPGQPGTGAPAWDAAARPHPPSGCAKVGIGVIALIGILFFVLVAIVVILVGNFANQFTGSGGTGNGGGLDAQCPFLSDDEARQVLGGQADAAELSGLAQATIGIIMDNRVLPGDPDCWVTDGQKAYIARVALHRGGDAAEVFARERQNAAPTSQDQGNGVTLEDSGYFGGDVSGIGDEAFCTGLSDAIMAGVLVRQGDRVVYVSVGGAAEGQQPPDMGTTDAGVVTAPGLCSLAQDLARKVLD